MLQFTTIDELKAHIEKDIELTSHCPVRFINVETMDIWVKVKSFITLLCTESIKLSDYCEVEDTTPNLKRLKTYLRKIQNNVLVTPLSEHLRINNNIALSTLNDILAMNFTNNDERKLKVYIPVYRMKSLLKNLSVDIRNKDSVIFLDTDSDCDYSLTVIQDTLNAKILGNEITGYKKYLVYWEENPDKPIVLHTQNAIHFTDIVFSDDVKVIVTAYDLLRFHYNLPDSIKQEWGETDKWHALLQNYKESASLDDVLGNVLGVRSCNNSLFENWKVKNEPDKWYIWLWAKYKAQSPYLDCVLEQSDTVSDFESTVYNSICSQTRASNYYELYTERLKLIKNMKTSPTSTFWDNIDNLSPIDRLKCLSCNTEKEQEMIFNILQSLSRNVESMQLIKTVYPELSYYLADTDFENEAFTDYFRQYKLQKALNAVNENFLPVVEKLASDQCVDIWNLKARNALVNSIYDDKSVILFVDALGVEYVSLLSELLKQRSLYVDFKFGHCNIPSTTEENKDFYEGKTNEKNFELDKIKHSNSVTYPFNLIKEFAEINKIVNQIVTLLTDKEQVIVAADHGTSRLAVLAKGDTFEAKSNAKKYKYGRYCVDSVNDYTTFSGCVNKDSYWIFANYNRFSSQGAPLLETHGGATLEECVVPVISVKKANKQKKAKEKIVITLLTETIKLSLNRSMSVKFKLSKPLENVVAVVNNIRYNCGFDGENYSFTPTVGKETQYTAKIVCKEIIGEFTYKVVKPIENNFDI